MLIRQGESINRRQFSGQGVNHRVRDPREWGATGDGGPWEMRTMRSGGLQEMGDRGK